MLATMVAAVVVAISGVVLSVGSSSAAPPAQPSGLDHFLCYKASSVAGVTPAFNVPTTGVQLLNQFSAAEFQPVLSSVADLHCNPAKKVVKDATGLKTSYPPVSPSWHLLCFQILRANQEPSTHVVQVTNQFGTAQLDTGPPQQLCLPSLKSTVTPPVFNPAGPNEIKADHFTCYPVTYDPNTQSRFVPPLSVKVNDQFTPAGTKITVQVGAPTSLCLPTQKTLPSGKVTPITNSTAHLLCFTVSATPVITPVWDHNQFGTGEVAIKKTSSLCLPSFKTLLK